MLCQDSPGVWLLPEEVLGPQQGGGEGGELSRARGVSGVGCVMGRGLQGQPQGQPPHQGFVFAVSVPAVCVSQDFLLGLSP